MSDKPKAKAKQVDNPLVAHVRHEMELVGMFKDKVGTGKQVAEDVLELSRVFAMQNHSGNSAPLVLQLFYRLCGWEMLGEPTDAPEEWELLKKDKPEEPDMWQNQRAPMYFSNDAGKHWKRVDNDEEGESKPANQPLAETKPKEEAADASEEKDSK